MKKLLKVLLFAVIAVFISTTAYAQIPGSQVGNNFWKWMNGILTPSINTWGLGVPSLGAPGNPCVTVSATGTFATQSCAGASSTGITSINSMTGPAITVIGSGTVSISSSSNTLTITGSASGGGSVSTSSIISVNNFPFWTSTGGALSGTSTLTVSSGNLNVSGTVSTNGVPYITTSTNNFGGLTNASITAVAPITWSAGSVIGFNTSTALILSGLYTFNGGATFNSTSTHNSSTLLIASTSIGTSTLNGILNIVGTTNQAGGVVSLASTTINGNATTTGITISGIASGIQCLHASATGVVTGTGSDCGAGGAGSLSTSSQLVANTLPIASAYNTFANSKLTQDSSALQIILGGLPAQAATSSLFQLGSNNIQGANASGTFLGANPTSTFNGDFIHFQIASSGKFMVNSSGTTVIGSSTDVSGGMLTIATATAIFSVDQNGKTLINAGTLSINTSTASGKLLVVGSSTVQAAANGVSTFQVNNAAGTSIVSADTTASQNTVFLVQTVNGTSSLSVASTGIVSVYGTSTVTLGGTLLAAAGNCTSTAVVVPLPLSTSTDNVFVTPQIYPGDGTEWNRATIDLTGAATSSVTIRVCADIAVTPTATKYNFNIFRMIGI